MAPIELEKLCRQLKYNFKDLSLLKQALTHCSVSQVLNNERLEFLGDSILNFVIADALFGQYPQESEGQLSRLRAYLVKGDTLAEIAQEIQLGDYLFLGQGELKSGGFRRASILADALEAVFAALYMDGGFEVSRDLILRLYQSRLSMVPQQVNLKDAKTQLQEYLQAQKKPLPEYLLKRVEGEEHQQTFVISCSVKGFPYQTEGQGATRRKAEQEAATLFLARIEKRFE